MKKKIISLIICILLLIYFIGGVLYNFVLKKEEKSVIKVKSNITIKGFDYILEDKDTKIYKEEFKKLKENLENKEIDYKEYAYSISKMFIIDLYSLNNKTNKYDIGGLDFVYPEAKDNYKLNVINTLNKYIEDNSDLKRKQELPEVKNVNITSFNETKFKLNDKDIDAYKINLNIEYIKDLKYDDKAELILIKEDKYLYIVEKN